MDVRAVGQGALLTLAVALPPVWLVRILKGGDLAGSESNLWLVVPVALLAGFALGGHLAGRHRPERAMTHGAAAGAAAFALLVVVSVVRRLFAGDDVSLPYLVRLLLLGQITISLALLGGYVAQRRSLPQ
jgi:hypothetical protein